MNSNHKNSLLSNFTQQIYLTWIANAFLSILPRKTKVDSGPQIPSLIGRPILTAS